MIHLGIITYLVPFALLRTCRPMVVCRSPPIVQPAPRFQDRFRPEIPAIDLQLAHRYPFISTGDKDSGVVAFADGTRRTVTFQMGPGGLYNGDLAMFPPGHWMPPRRWIGDIVASADEVNDFAGGSLP